MRGRRFAAILLLPSLAACSWWMSGRPTEMADGRTHFNHSLHVEDFGLSCEECHAVSEATALSGSFIPAETLCLDCHDRESECTTCHPDPDNVRPILADNAVIRFSHAAHVGTEGVECTTCHSGVLAAAVGERVAPPDHATCFSCHNHEENYAQANCETCHTSLQRVPLEALAEFDHSGDWLARHGAMAQSAGAACFQCHTESTCAACHSTTAPAMPARLWPERVGNELVHRGDWLHSHPIEARADADMCLRCHETTFCQDCHADSGLSLTSATPLAVHPDGWMNPSSPDFHGPPARQQIVACASCHDQGAASNCVDCHRVGGVGGSPHPAGFMRDDPDDDPMCQICHGP